MTKKLYYYTKPVRIFIATALLLALNGVATAQVAVNDTLTATEDIVLTGNVATNDTVVNNPQAQFTLVTQAGFGTVVLNTDGTFSYTPFTDVYGNDEFTYSLCDGGSPAVCDTATVYITVMPVNDAPVAADDALTITEDTPANGNVSTNDTDIDGLSATYTVAGNPNNGTLVLGTDGVFIYTPDAHFDGCDTAWISLCDGGIPNKCDTSLLIVCISPVNDAPVAVDDNATTVQTMDVTGNVSTNDTDADGPTATYTVVSNPNNGTLVLSTNGQYIYNPNPSFLGCDTAVISVCDGGTPELCDTSLLVVCVTPANLPPVAQNDSLTSPEDAVLLINVLANDVDPEGQLGNPTVLTGPAHGTAVVNGDGTITYTPNSNYFGTDSFTYVVCDGGTPALCDTASVILTITSVDDAIVITAQPLVTDEDVTTTTCFAYQLSDTTDSVLVTVVCSPAHGMVDSITAANGQICITYTPGREYNGDDSLCIELCDLAGGGCTRATVYVTINPVVDACLWLKGISPNGDGQNDSFWINCNSDFPNATLRIFNRWGDEVYRSNGHYNNDWYGRNQTEKDLPDGTYYYIYDYGDGAHKAHAGFITINR